MLIFNSRLFSGTYYNILNQHINNKNIILLFVIHICKELEIAVPIIKLPLFFFNDKCIVSNMLCMKRNKGII